MEFEAETFCSLEQVIEIIGDLSSVARIGKMKTLYLQ